MSLIFDFARGANLMNTIHPTDPTTEPRSTLLYRWGRFAARNPWRVVGCWALVAVAALLLNALIGGGVANIIRVPGTESQSAADLLNARFPSRGEASGLVVFADHDGVLTDPGPFRTRSQRRPASRRLSQPS
jgi:hypothetical protein